MTIPSDSRTNALDSETIFPYFGDECSPMIVGGCHSSQGHDNFVFNARLVEKDIYTDSGH